MIKGCLLELKLLIAIIYSITNTQIDKGIFLN